MLEKKNFYINGKWSASKNKKQIEVIDPATEKSCAVISLGGKEDVHSAVIAAKNAFTWGIYFKRRKNKIIRKTL
jgi:aldehyde dehydrogenase (NAD+)